MCQAVYPEKIIEKQGVCEYADSLFSRLNILIYQRFRDILDMKFMATGCSYDSCGNDFSGWCEISDREY